MTTPDTPTPYRATDDDWRCVEDNAVAGSKTHRCIRTMHDLLSLTREALAALEQRVGELEGGATTLVDIGDAFERAGQQVAALHAPGEAPAPAAAPAPPKSCWLDDEPDVAPTPCVFDDPSETIESCVYATLIRNEGKTKTTCKHYKAPSPPSGSLVEVVSAVIANSIACNREDDDTASEIIAAIAEELHRRGDHGVAAWLEREAGR